MKHVKLKVKPGRRNNEPKSTDCKLGVSSLRVATASMIITNKQFLEITEII